MLIFSTTLSFSKERDLGALNKQLSDELTTTMATITDKLVAVKTQNGIIFKSKETFINSKGEVEPKVNMNVEGPFRLNNISNLEKAIDYHAQSIKDNVDKDYKFKFDNIYPGMWVDKPYCLNVEVGILYYKFPTKPNTQCLRGVIYKNNSTFIVTATIHQFEPNEGMGTIFTQLLCELALSKHLDEH